MIGPWSHSGFLDNRVGHNCAGRRSKFNHLSHILAFFDRCCGLASPPETVAALDQAAKATPPEGLADSAGLLLTFCLKAVAPAYRLAGHIR